MVRSLTIWIPGQPPTVTAQQQIITKTGRVVYGKKVTEARQILEGRLSEHVPAEPFTEALCVTAIWCWSRAGKKKSEWKTTRPDLDNLAKMLLDTMTKLCFWKDDAIVVQLSLTKIWNQEPGIKITITQLENLK